MGVILVKPRWKYDSAYGSLIPGNLPVIHLSSSLRAGRVTQSKAYSTRVS